MEIIGDDGIDGINSNDSDPEKIQPRVIEERWGDQISHEMLEVLAPNGEGEHILNIINNMTEEEAVAIIWESVKFHADDWNFVSLFRASFSTLRKYGG
jgi:hypothetical protein